MNVGEYKAEIFQAREDEGFEGNGYDWGALAKVFLEEQKTELIEMPKSSIFFLITFIFLLFGCTRNNMPSDHQMLEHFNLYESEFERLRKISVKYDGYGIKNKNIGEL